MADMTGLAAGLNSLGQALAPQNFIAALNQADEFNRRKVRQAAFEESIKDLDFRASRDPALLKRVKKLQQLHPQAFADPESYARFNAHLTQYEAGEELIDKMEAGGHLGTGVVADAWRKSLISNPDGTINDIANFLKGQEAASMQLAKKQELESKREQELAGIDSTARSLLSVADSPDDILRAADQLGLTGVHRSQVLARAEQIFSSLQTAESKGLAIEGQERALDAQDQQANAASEAAAFLDAMDQGPPLSQAEQLDFINRQGEGSLSEPAKAKARELLGSRINVERAEGAGQAGMVKALTEAEKARQKYDESLAARELDWAMVEAIIDRLPEEAQRSKDALNEYIKSKSNQAFVEKELTGTGMTQKDLLRFMAIKDMHVQEEFGRSLMISIDSDAALADSGLNTIQQKSEAKTSYTVPSTGPGPVTPIEVPAVRDEILTGSTQFRNAAALRNSDIQVATNDSFDLDAGEKVDRAIVMLGDRNLVLTQKGDGKSHTSFSVNADGSVNPVLLEKQDDGALLPVDLPPEEAKRVYLDDTLVSLKTQYPDNPRAAVKTLKDSYKKFSAFLKKKDDEDMKVLARAVDNAANMIRFTETSGDTWIVAARSKANFEKLRATYDALITNAVNPVGE